MVTGAIISSSRYAHHEQSYVYLDILHVHLIWIIYHPADLDMRSDWFFGDEIGSGGYAGVSLSLAEYVNNCICGWLVMDTCMLLRIVSVRPIQL